MNTNKAFTIVELIIVIVLIGILSAITIVSYSSMSQRANTASLLAAANTVVAKAEVYKSNTGDYPATMSVLTGANSTDPAYIPTSAAVYSNFGQTDLTNLTSGMSAPVSPWNKVRYIVCGYASSSPANVAAMTVKTGVIGLTWNFNTSPSAPDITNYQGIVNFGGGAGSSTATSYVVGGTTFQGRCLDAGS